MNKAILASEYCVQRKIMCCFGIFFILE